MRSVYIREQKKYRKEELEQLLDMKEEELDLFLKKLKKLGIVKNDSADREQPDLQELTREFRETEEDGGVWVFSCVGIVTDGNRVLKCCPKYLSGEAPLEELKEILQVLRKYESREQKLGSGETEENGGTNRLALMLLILDDYLEYGPYTNYRTSVESGGSGEVLWEETLAGTPVLTGKGKPLYPELRTLAVNEDEQDYFRALHRQVVAECMETLRELELAELFDLTDPGICPGDREEFGDTDFILYRLEQEQNVQFYDRKRRVLHMLYQYLAMEDGQEGETGFSFYGTCSFHAVWEKVCAQAFGNCLETRIQNLPLTGKPEEFRRDRRTLLELIEKPKWQEAGTGIRAESSHTLRPDIVRISEKDGSRCFSIIDAKYYLPYLRDGKVENAPGVEDVAKQYLYQMAYQDFIRKGGFEKVENIFVFPGEGEETEYLGEVRMEMFHHLLSREPEAVKLYRVPARKLYQGYLEGKALF